MYYLVFSGYLRSCIQWFCFDKLSFCLQSWGLQCSFELVILCRKLIGARFFSKGYEAHGGKLDASHYTARDYDGHGTHTLSTAGGNFVPGANVFGYGNGTAKGGCPKARVAAYKVCWPPIDGNECFDADILAAYDAAVADGVDVLSVSLGGDPIEYLNDGISIGAFHAVKEGITVVSSAGNMGPGAGTVSNAAPWMFTVAASTTDREFTAVVSLGNKVNLKVFVYQTFLPTNFLGFVAVQHE